MQRPLWLNDKQVACLLDHNTAYESVEAALIDHSNGDYTQPLKPYLRPCGRDGERHGGRYICMPASVGRKGSHVPGLKWIASVPANVDRGIPRASGLVVINSAETGQVLAIMECATLSARRTAAVAAISFDHLAPGMPRIVSLLGAGPINFQTAEALLTRDRGIIGFNVYDPNRSRALSMATAIETISGVPVAIPPSAQQACRNATVVVCATTGASGYLQRCWLTTGALVIALSLDDPADDTFLAAQVVTDDWDQACREDKLLHRLTKAGRFSRAQLFGELGHIVNGHSAGRTSDDELFLVAPMGMAIEDVTVGKRIFDLAVATGVGSYLP